jgi:hypothetical protein
MCPAGSSQAHSREDGCNHSHPPERSDQVRLNFQVLDEGLDVLPAVAPDSTPAWFRHDSSYTSNGILKRIMDVCFTTGPPVYASTGLSTA